MKEFIINEATSGRKSLTFISKILPNAGFGFIQKMIRKKNITLNGSKMTGNEILKPGDSIKIFFSDETFDKFAATISINENEFINAYHSIKGIEIIYEDDEYIILNKPVNVLSQKADNSMPSLNEWLVGYLMCEHGLSADSLKSCKPSICNRLDRNTQGLVLAAKTVHGLNTFNELIKTRKIEKHYWARCIGSIKNNSGEITGYLSKDETKNISNVIDDTEYNKLDSSHQASYKPIKLKYSVLSTSCIKGTEVSDVDIDLITGKSHQIRAQMAHIGHPLLGDMKYGNESINALFRANSQFLKAYKVIFPTVDDLGALSGKTIMLEV